MKALEQIPDVAIVTMRVRMRVKTVAETRV